MKALALAFALALALPTALAGTRANPDIVGQSGDVLDPTVDFLAAWLEPAAKGVRFTVEVRSLPDVPQDRYYAIVFTTSGDRHVAVVATDSAKESFTDLRAPNFNGKGLAPERMDDVLRDPTIQTGQPGLVSATLPYGALPGIEPGKVMLDLGACVGTYTRSSGSWDDVDCKQTQNAYVVPQSTNVIARWLPTPLALAVFATLGAGVGLAIALVLAQRRRKA